MKRALSFLLILTFLLGFNVSAMAVDLIPEADSIEIMAGEHVIVTVSLDEPISEEVLLMQGQLFYVNDLFDYVSATDLSDQMNGFSQETDSENGAYILFDLPAFGGGVPAGKLCEITFVAKENIGAEETATFKTTLSLMTDSDPTGEESAGNSITVTVKPQVSGYSVSLDPEQNTVNQNETVYVNVSIASGEQTRYNAVDMLLSYTGVTFDEDKSTIPANASVSDGNGCLRVRIFGEDKLFSDVFRLAFSAAGDGTVSLLSAQIDDDAHSDAQNAPAATITTGSVSFDVEVSYSVSLPEGFTGAETVAEGTDYTFTAKDIHYDHVITATMGGETVEVKSDGNGVYTIANVTGDLDIQAKSTPKTYAVTVKGSAAEDVKAASTATYLTDYSFRVEKVEEYSYGSPEITIDGKEFTGYSTLESQYTIPGASITGPVVITLEKEEIKPETVAVRFDGSGAGDAIGEKTADFESDYTFTLNKAEGYVYTVTATMGGETASVAENGDGSYTIPKVTADLVIQIDKTGKRTVEASEYITLPDETILYLIVADGTLEEGQAFTYNGSTMHWSEQYKKYVWLVISQKTMSAMLEEAETAVGISSSGAETIDLSGDVNGTGLVDINDAQLVYNMYMAKYTDFNQVPMMKFLRADLNGDAKVNVQDAVAAVNKIK